MVYRTRAARLNRLGGVIGPHSFRSITMQCLVESMAGTLTPYQKLFLGSKNQLGLCIVTLLAWIASSDGSLSDEEMGALEEIANAGKNSTELKSAIQHARKGNISDLQLACEVVRSLDKERKELFLQMAIGIAVADGYLAIPENHILRFLADVIGYSPKQLAATFEELTNKPFPAPGDPSTVEWWLHREGDHSRRDESSDESRQDAPRTGQHGMSRAQALDVLGLDASASMSDIKQAFRHLANTHHPDRFSKLGPEAVKAANVIFIRIKSAYETLTT